MTQLFAIVIATLLAAASPLANASGVIGPANAQLTYSFNCPSGAHGQIAYSRALPPGKGDRFLVAMVNGSYIQNDPRIVALLAGVSISSVSAGCEGDTAVVFLETWRDEGEGSSRKGSIIIYVDKSGSVKHAG